MRVIRGDIIADQITFNVPAQTYRENNFGTTRLETLHKVASIIGIEIADIATMQAIPAGNKYVLVCRSRGGSPDGRSSGVLPMQISQGE